MVVDPKLSREGTSAMDHNANKSTLPVNISSPGGNSDQTDSSSGPQSPSSLSETTGSPSSGEGSTLFHFSPPIPLPKLSLSSKPISVFIKLCNEQVENVTSRIKEIPDREVFAGTYSTVWQVPLKGLEDLPGVLVRGFPHHKLPAHCH